MKRVTVLLLILGIFMGSIGFMYFNPVIAQEKEVADEDLREFKDSKKYNLPEEHMYILDEAKEDVNGNGQSEKIYLLGKRYEDSPIFMEKTYILVENAKGSGYVVEIPEGMGYIPSMSLADVNGDSVKDVMVALPTGGSGGIVNYLIYSLKDDKPTLIFDSNKTTLDINGFFEDNYKAKITIKDSEGTYDLTATVDLKDRKDMYDEVELYKDGKLTNPQELMPNPYGLIKLKDVDNDGVYELETYQAIKGTCNADGVAIVIANWKWDNGSWEVISLGLSKLK